MLETKSQNSTHREKLFSAIRQLLTHHATVQGVVVCGSYARGDQKYFGIEQREINSDLDAVILSPSRRAAKEFRRELYAIMASLGISASASTRQSYDNFLQGERSVSLYEFDEINSGLFLSRDSEAKPKTPKTQFGLNASLTLPISELVMLVINRYFELVNTEDNGSNRAQEKLDAAVETLARRLGTRDQVDPAAIIRLAARDSKNLTFHKRYFQFKRRVLWTIRTRRIWGHPVNTLHIYNNCIQACINGRSLESVVHSALDEWRKGTA